LGHEASELVQRGHEQIRENDDKGQRYQDSEQKYLVHAAFDNLRDFESAVENGDYDMAQKEAADALNYLLMALSNMGQDGRGPTKNAYLAADAVLSDLQDRRGIRQAFEEIDDDVMADIRTELAGAIYDVYKEEPSNE
jgi:hypothetical protein